MLQSVQHNIKLQGVMRSWWHQFGEQQALLGKPTRLVTKSAVPTCDMPSTICRSSSTSALCLRRSCASHLCLEMVLLRFLLKVIQKSMLVQGAVSVCCCPAAGRGRPTAIAPAG